RGFQVVIGGRVTGGNLPVAGCVGYGEEPGPGTPRPVAPQGYLGPFRARVGAIDTDCFEHLRRSRAGWKPLDDRGLSGLVLVYVGQEHGDDVVVARSGDREAPVCPRPSDIF